MVTASLILIWRRYTSIPDEYLMAFALTVSSFSS